MYETWEIFWDVVAFSNSRTEFQFTSFLWRLLCFEWRIKVFPSGFFFFSPLVPFIITVTYPRSSKLKNLRWNTSNSGPYNYILFTLFENHPKCRILAFSINFCPIEINVTCLITVFDRKLQVFKNSSKLTILGLFVNFCPLK